MKRFMFAFILLGFISALSAQQNNAGAGDEDLALQQRVHELSKELRCLKCQNQSIADSKSGFADMIRREVTDQFRQGKTPDEVKQFLITRYGDFIVYEPPFTLVNSIIWLSPVVILVAGLVVLFVFIRRQQQSSADEEGMDDEKLNKILKERNAKGESS